MTDEKRLQVAFGDKGVIPKNIEEAWRVCDAIVQSGLVPKGMTASQAFMVMQAGAELGMGLAQSLQELVAINGRVGPRGQAALGLLRRANVLDPEVGLQEYMTGEAGMDDWTAHVKTRRKGESISVETSFSVADAKRARLWGKAGPWTEYPNRMLHWRAVGFHIDDFYSDVLMGFHVAEVLDDYPTRGIQEVTAWEERPKVTGPDPVFDPDGVNPDSETPLLDPESGPDAA